MSDYVSMTPAQVLKGTNWAVVRFIDGGFGWFAASYVTREGAEVYAAQMRVATNGGDYRVVRIVDEPQPAEIDMDEVTPGNTEQVYTDQPVPPRGE